MGSDIQSHSTNETENPSFNANSGAADPTLPNRGGSAPVSCRRRLALEHERIGNAVGRSALKRRMNAKSLAAGALALLSALAAAKPNAQDTRFVASIAFGNTFESRGGKLALKKSPNGGLRDYGTMLVSDHGHAQEKLAKIAKDKGLTTPGVLAEADRKLIAKFEGLKGGAFDGTYKRAVLVHHRHALMGIDKEIRAGLDPEILVYAREMRVMVSGHIRALEAIRV